MPGWHAKTKQLRENGDIQFVGIVQEQHGDRARLFMQWQGMAWPVMVDSLNLLGVTVVPITLLVDENGVIRARPKSPEDLKLAVGQRLATPEAVDAPDVSALAAAAKSAADFRNLGDAAYLWGERPTAIAAYDRSLAIDPEDARAHFRRGVALLQRFEGGARQPGDFGTAVAAWTRALELRPDNYIWRRRIQQYGPQLDKPYPFYDWVSTAVRELKHAGKTPVRIQAQLTDSEKVTAKRGFDTTAGTSPDPDGKIPRDSARLVAVETALAPAAVELGKAARLHVIFLPDKERKVHWDSETPAPTVWFEAPDGWSINTPLVSLAGLGEGVPRDEARRCEVEVLAGPKASGSVMKCYALYYVCEDIDGTCQYLRQEFEVRLIHR